MKRIILSIFSALFLITMPASGKDMTVEIWKVSERTGDVELLRSGLQPASLRNDAQLKPGDVVATGATGRAVLTRSADYVIVAPNSRVQIPAATAPGGITRFFQQAGTLLFKVRRMGVPHFQVQTPMLAAVVKGTTFTVIVDGDRSAVQVTEGKVEVTAASGGMQRLVLPGETVFINRERPADLVLASPETVGGTEATTTGAIWIDGTAPEPLSTIGTVTAGLVQEAVVAAPVQVAALVVAPPPVSQVVSPSQAPSSAAPETAAVIPPVSTPEIVAPVITPPAVTTPPATVPPVTVPPVTVPPVTTPPVTVPPVSLPPVTLPPVTVPPVSLPPVTLPPVTLPPVTVPPVTLPPVTLPPVQLPPVTLPPVTLPPVTLPPVTVPPVTLPPVQLPPVTLPPVAIPPVTLPPVQLPPITLPPLFPR